MVAPAMKQKLRAAIEAGLRRLPVARAAYAERDALSERLVSTEAKLAETTAALAAKAVEVEVARGYGSRPPFNAMAPCAAV